MASDEKPKKTAGRPLGPIGEAVRANVKTIRENRGLSQGELSARMSALGRPIPPLGIHRIENGDRRVDVDDLVAISVVLNVSPLAILLPTSGGPVVPQGNSYSAEDVWNWAKGGFPLTESSAAGRVDMNRWLEYMQLSNPFNDFSTLPEAMKALGFAQGKDRSARGND